MRWFLVSLVFVLVLSALVVCASDFSGSARIIVESFNGFNRVFDGSAGVTIKSFNEFGKDFSGFAGVVVVEEVVTNGSGVSGSFVGGTPCWYFSSAGERVCVLAVFPDSVVSFDVPNVSDGSWVVVVPVGAYNAYVPPQNVSVESGRVRVVADLRGHSGFEWVCLYDVALNHSCVNGSVIDVEPLRIVHEVKGDAPLCSLLKSTSTTTFTSHTVSNGSGSGGGGVIVPPSGVSNHYGSDYVGPHYVVRRVGWVVSFVRSSWVILLLLVVGTLLLLSSSSGRRRR